MSIPHPLNNLCSNQQHREDCYFGASTRLQTQQLLTEKKACNITIWVKIVTVLNRNPMSSIEYQWMYYLYTFDISTLFIAGHLHDKLTCQWQKAASGFKKKGWKQIFSISAWEILTFHYHDACYSPPQKQQILSWWH